MAVSCYNEVIRARSNSLSRGTGVSGRRQREIDWLAGPGASSTDVIHGKAGSGAATVYLYALRSP